jgi:F0F1-type ATP synthase assembly protein I
MSDQPPQISSGPPDNAVPPDPAPPQDDPFLSGAYRRILRTSIVLSVAASIAATVMNRQAGIGVAVGSLIACLNFVWLHQGADLLIRRMLPGSGTPSRFWIIQSFPVRYFVVIAAAYVILKSYPGMRVGFIVGLVLPILAMMCEGAYEALFSTKKSQSPKI